MSEIRVVCTGLLYGQVCQNVLHFLNTSNVFTLPQVAGDVVNNYVSKVATRQQAEFKWVNILVTNLSDPTQAAFSQVLDIPGQSFGSRNIPSFVSFVIKLSTGIAGKHGRGRIYTPGVNFNAMQDNFFSSAEILAWENNVFPSMRSAYIDDPDNALTLCVRQDNGFMNAVTAIQLRPSVGCQRRRMTGVGV